jgi:hypothetical protein
MIEYEFTAKRIEKLRDEDHLSWAKVAEALSLGSPGAARRAYTALVRPHTESVLPGGSRSGSGLTPVDLAGMAQAKVADTIAGRTIVVQRRNGTEDVYVERVTSVKADTINFNDGAKSRSVKAQAVIALK